MSFEEYNAGRAERGRAPIARETFEGMEGVGITAADLAGWLEGSTALYAAKQVKAAEVADYWRSIAPVWGDSDPKGKQPPSGLRTGGTGDPNYPGGYKASIKVIRHHGTVAVGSTLFPLALFLEYGTERTPTFACGARTLAYFGGGAVDAESRTSERLYLI